MPLIGRWPLGVDLTDYRNVVSPTGSVKSLAGAARQHDDRGPRCHDRRYRRRAAPALVELIGHGSAAQLL
jgi:hypothetical protein